MIDLVEQIYNIILIIGKTLGKTFDVLAYILLHSYAFYKYANN